ncbi:hypothetical protein GCM10027034_35940 [Ramlibacter solisilvae]|uniref:Uncharacterized protein n=1 Tax=Ramlibacter tataouinensis TaxID=94132 RepID=A0A127JV71_9BURK|nr:hypothetical protein [Ramlibacter tataouinensis]AMO23783.1 hypothetical protein UC35_14005 [Ramlibacter tataouinensis]
MSFLNQLKTQARALQTQQERDDVDLQHNTAETEQACRTILFYLRDLAGQLNVISPAAPKFSLDGRTPWPAMKLVDFRVDSRRKMLRNKEAFEYLGMGWRIVPQIGQPVGGSVRVNFPPDLQRVESRLAMGPVKHERKDLRHPEKNTLLAYQFDYITETRGSIMIAPDHDKALIAFRLMNATGFDIINVSWPAAQIKSELLDELAKLIVSQPQRFVV